MVTANPHSHPRTASDRIFRTGGTLFAGNLAAGALGAMTWLAAARLYAVGTVGTAVALVGAVTFLGLLANLGLGTSFVSMHP